MSDSTATITSTDFEVIPFTEHCRTIWDRGDHLLIGVSPGNSYFTHQRIRELVTWADRWFSAIDIVYADLHVDTMFAALGHTAEHAGRRASKELKAVRRRVLRGVDDAAAGPGGLTAQVRVRALSEFADDLEYRRLHIAAEQALDYDPEFRAACEDMVQQFLGPKVGAGNGVTGEQRRACLRYITAELPFFVDTPAIVGTGSSVSSYHAEMPLTEVLFARGSGFHATANQAYAVVRPYEERDVNR